MRVWAILLAVALPFSCHAVPQASQTRFVLEDGTPIKLVLAETISSADEHKGNLVLFTVAEEVALGDVVVIPKGANAWGTITIVKPKRKLGRPGKLEVAIDKVRLADGEKAPLIAIRGENGDSHQGQMATGIAVSGVFAWPAAPLFLLIHGKDVTMPKGTETMAFVQGDDTLDPAKFTPAALAAANNLPPPQTPAALAASPGAASASAAATASASASAISAPESAPNTAPTGPEGPGPTPAPAPNSDPSAPPNDPGKTPQQ
jgi:hypothetical protein